MTDNRSELNPQMSDMDDWEPCPECGELMPEPDFCDECGWPHFHDDDFNAPQDKDN